jgi:hypothetical protein
MCFFRGRGEVNATVYCFVDGIVRNRQFTGSHGGRAAALPLEVEVPVAPCPRCQCYCVVSVVVVRGVWSPTQPPNVVHCVCVHGQVWAAGNCVPVFAGMSGYPCAPRLSHSLKLGHAPRFPVSLGHRLASHKKCKFPRSRVHVAPVTV